MAVSRLGRLLVGSLVMLKNHPKLFLPKMLLAALYGIAMLWVADLYLRVLPLATMQPSPEAAAEAAKLLGILALAMLYYAFLEVADILINSMYPSMIAAYHAGRAISFARALRISLRRFPVMLPASVSATVIFLAAALPFIMLFQYAQLSGSALMFWVSAAALLCVLFAAAVIFYLLYPIAVLEHRSFFGVLLRTARLSRKNFSDFSKASVFPFAVSLLNFLLAFLASAPAFLLAFILLRFLTAVVYTYHMVLSPAVYFEYVGAG